ncbi:hypothetical protein B0H13DRAFT_1901796 [Mycena leptocephala]|nr:hypothetical protein B0H13DRAFT_1901796 [Mycena leptocephala]
MAEVIGVVAAALQFLAVLQAGIGIGVDARNAVKEQQDLLREVRSLEPLLKQLQDRLLANLSVDGIQQLEQPLVQFEQTLKHIVLKLESANKPGMEVAKAVRWTLWNKKEVQQAVEEMERFKTLLNNWLTLDIWDRTLQQQKHHNQLLKTIGDASEQHHEVHGMQILILEIRYSELSRSRRTVATAIC